MSNPYEIQCITDVEEPSVDDLDRYWGNLFYANSIVFVAAEPKCGKTFFMLDAAMHLSANKSFLNYKSHKPVKTLYLNVDDPSNFWEKRLYDMKQTFDGDLSNLYHKKFDNFDIMDYEQLSRLKDTVDVLKPNIVVFDTLRRVHSLDENKSENWTIIKNKVDEIRTVNDCCVILIHHLRKRNPKNSYESIFERMRGSSDILAMGNTFIGLEERINRREEYINFLSKVKNGPSDNGKLKLMFDKRSLHYTKETEREIDYISNYISMNPNISQADLVEHLDGNVYECDRRTIVRNLENFEMHGRLKRVKNGRIWQYV